MSTIRIGDAPPEPGTKKIAEPPERCRDPEHEPAKHRVYTPGVYQHTCPTCGAQVTFTVRETCWELRGRGTGSLFRAQG